MKPFWASVVLILVGLITSPVAERAPSPVTTALVEQTNAERARAGLSTLQPNSRLMEAAQIHAEQVTEARRLAHELPGFRYPRLTDRIAAVDYEWTTIGENLAFGQRDAVQAMVTWMKSQGHRANILNRQFTEIGTGYIVDRTGRPYYVQVFGRPAS